MSNDNNTRYLPVSALTTFLSRWSIKTRVVAKSTKFAVKTGNSFFHVDLVDQNGDAIRAKFWGDSAEKWHPILQEGKVYTFSKGRLSLANKRFSNIPHNYELTFDANADIKLTEDEGNINTQKNYSLMCLRDIKNSNRELPFMVDLLVFITNIGPATQVSSRVTNEQLSRRTIVVADNSEYTFDVTLWNEIAINEENLKLNEVCVISNIQVKEWNNTRVGQTSKSSEITFSYKSKKADELNKWILQNSKSASYKSMRDGNGKTFFDETKQKYKFVKIATLKQQIEDNQEEGSFTVFGRVRRMYYKSKDGDMRISYPGCPKCKKKLTENNQYFNCMTCNEDVLQPSYRYMFAFRICDYTDQLTVRAFHDQGLQLLAIAPAEINKMSKLKIEEIFEWDLLYNEIQVSLKSRVDNFSGESRMNHIAMRVEPINYQNCAIELLNKIKYAVPNATSFGKNKKLKRDEMSDEDNDDNAYYLKKEKMEV